MLDVWLLERYIVACLATRAIHCYSEGILLHETKPQCYLTDTMIHRDLLTMLRGRHSGALSMHRCMKFVHNITRAVHWCMILRYNVTSKTTVYVSVYT